MKNILVFDPSQKERKILTKCVRRCLNSIDARDLTFLYFHPEDVFKGEIPEEAYAAFFTLENMTGAEAAKQFGKYRENIPLVIVSDTGEFAGESWSYGARYYITRPLTADLMCMALRKCMWI